MRAKIKRGDRRVHARVYARKSITAFGLRVRETHVRYTRVYISRHLGELISASSHFGSGLQFLHLI